MTLGCAFGSRWSRMWAWNCRACALLLLVGEGFLGAGGHAAVYADFRVQAFAPSVITNESFSGKFADPDGDGLVNFLEHALGLDPTRADA